MLPFYLQQLEMELNGKSVTTDGTGRALDRAGRGAGPVPTRSMRCFNSTPGHRASPGRVRRGARGRGGPGRRAPPVIAAQCLRPGRGADAAVARLRIRSAPIPATGRARRSCSTASTPGRSGALIAFYEHRTFANAVLLGINPFDQFGSSLARRSRESLSEGSGRGLARPVHAALMERAGI